MRQLLNICQPGALKDGDELCRSDTRSDEMYILLTDQLSVVTAEGLRVATILPVTTVGEMGIITGQPRTATVVSVGKSNVFEISKIKFEVMLKKFPAIGFVIFRNIILALSNRLDTTNQQLTEKSREIERLNTEGQAIV